jgi:L-histidine Nalpha-methyltransferase
MSAAWSAVETAVPVDLAEAVRRGLSAPRKSLPPFIFYDAEGSELFERITELPEYYLTRTERGILEQDADAIAARLLGGARGPVAVLELGAGTATKTDLLLHAFVRARSDVHFFPADVSPTPLAAARARLAASLPTLRVSSLVGTHGDALGHLSGWEGELVVLFLGSSIGNYADADATALLTEVKDALGARGTFLLGVDRAKSLETLLPAYDDAAGVTAAFNGNMLARINRELAGEFDLTRFRHVALWNEAASAIEMHLESLAAQTVRIGALDLSVRFARGERIHTESSHKYTDRHVQSLLEAAGLASVASFEDAERWFSLHVARRR